MIYKAYQADTQRLLSLPETGMGFQVIEATVGNKARRYIAFNAELIVDLDGPLLESRSIFKEGYVRVLANAQNFPAPTSSIRLLSRDQFAKNHLTTEATTAKGHRYHGGKGAKDNPQENADGSEFFVRLSAYENDRRVDFVNQCFRPGTYATTLGDYMVCVQTEDDPIDRYALPSDEEIKWTFHVQPKTRDRLRRGFVQPAFGHAGGGLEVLFDDGTSHGTFFLTRPYGQ